MSEATYIPQHIAEGRRAPYPKGTFLGDLTKVSESWSKDSRFLDYALEFRNVQPVEGPAVGNRPYQPRIRIIENVNGTNVSVVDIRDFDDASVPFSLRRSATLISQLAVSVGGAEFDAANHRVAFPEGIEQFLLNLNAGLYNGRKVRFEVGNRPWISKRQRADGTFASGVDDGPIGFAAAEANGAPVEEADVVPQSGPAEATTLAEVVAMARTTNTEFRARR